MGRTDWTRAVKLLTYAERVDAFRLAQVPPPEPLS
jgi:hypothetical protein